VQRDHAGARVSLKDESDDTLLAYSAQADIGGKLASVGSRLVQTVARKNADDFFSAFAKQLGGTGVQEPVVVAPAGVSPAVPARVPAAAWGGGLGSPVPAWLVVFCTGLGLALGYCIALLAR
jgi:hypothetical protein